MGVHALESLGAVLVNIYPIVSDDFLSCGRGRLDRDRLPQGVSFEFLEFEYPSALKQIYSEKIVATNVAINGIGCACVTYFCDGVFAIETRRSASALGLTDLISIADYERERISTWLATVEGASRLSGISAAYYEGSKISKGFRLTYAYSHNIVSSNLEDLSKNNFPNSKWRIARSDYVCNIYSEPAVNLINPHDGEEDRATGALRNLTVIIATLYAIQEICIRTSRRVVEGELLERGVFERVSELERQLGLLQQFINEVKMIDFLSDPFEEAISRTVARAWEWNKVRDQALDLCRHLQNQIEKMNNEVERQSNGRMNRILFAFTFLTTLDVAASILSFHDLENVILPWFRAVYILGVFVLVALVVKWYVGKGNKR